MFHRSIHIDNGSKIIIVYNKPQPTLINAAFSGILMQLLGSVSVMLYAVMPSVVSPNKWS